MLTDTHAHLDFPDFANDLPDMLNRARSRGIHRVITIGTTIEGARRTLSVAANHADVYATVGVHPSNAMEASMEFATELRELAGQPRVVALGECGLDYHRLPSRQMHESAVATMAMGNETAADVGCERRRGGWRCGWRACRQGAYREDRESRHGIRSEERRRARLFDASDAVPWLGEPNEYVGVVARYDEARVRREPHHPLLGPQVRK